MHVRMATTQRSNRASAVRARPIPEGLNRETHSGSFPWPRPVPSPFSGRRNSNPPRTSLVLRPPSRVMAGAAHIATVRERLRCVRRSSCPLPFPPRHKPVPTAYSTCTRRAYQSGRVQARARIPHLCMPIPCSRSRALFKATTIRLDVASVGMFKLFPGLKSSRSGFSPCKQYRRRKQPPSLRLSSIR
jgi:hypothetical protein